MSTKTRINVNVDIDLKEKSAKTLEDLGFDFTTAITVFLKQVVKKKMIPFEISERRYYTVEEVAGKNWRDGLDKIEDEWE